MKSLKINWKEILGKRGMPLVLATTMAMGLGGCGKKAECSIEGDHAHLYVSDDNFSRYLEKEYLTYEGYERQDDYIVLDDKYERLRRFEDKKDLLKIDENIDTIRKIEDENQDYIEYRYAYTYKMPVPHYTHIGKSTYVNYTYIPVTRYSWTTDVNHNRLTGEQRKCHYVYQAYNTFVDDHGEYVLIPSNYVDSIEELKGEYTYIKKDFFKVVDAELETDLDYEDGEVDDSDLVEEDEQNLLEEEKSKQVSEKGKVLEKK